MNKNFILLMLCMASINVFAQGEVNFKNANNGKVKEMVQKTLPAYIERGVVKGNINSTFGRNGNACEYNKQGIKINQVYDDGETRFPIEFRYEYDGKRVASQALFINPPNSNLWKTNYFKYDAKGKKIVEVVSISANGDSLERTTFRYENNLLMEEIYCNYKYPEEQYISEYMYDNAKQNNPSKIKYYTLANGEKTLGSICASSYDEHGNEIVNEMYDAEGNLSSSTTNKYIYGKKGNWVRKETYLNGEVYNLTEREFIFH
ncbi:MAG: hypothetical protein ACK5JS_08585 [Mangrovibacterium sp.]